MSDYFNHLNIIIISGKKLCKKIKIQNGKEWLGLFKQIDILCYIENLTNILTYFYKSNHLPFLCMHNIFKGRTLLIKKIYWSGCFTQSVRQRYASTA